MAPLPADDNKTPNAAEQKPEPLKDAPWSTAAIVALAIFLVFAICLTATLILYYLHRRKQHKKLPADKRPTSYHPFRTQSSDKSGLLANAAPSPEEDKSSMFSRERGSSLSLYVNTEYQDRRASMETVSLIPLHVTPAEETSDPMSATTSAGSGVSGGSSVYSSTTGGSLGISNIPIPENAADGSRPTRPRSTSAASARYYEINTTDLTPQIPKIVHTPSP